MTEADILQHAPLLVVTKGEKGCTDLTRKDGVEDVPAVTPDRIEDPTGVGDAFRGGFMKGLAMGAPYEVCGPAGQRRRDLRARASRRHQPRLHLGGVRRPLQRALPGLAGIPSRAQAARAVRLIQTGMNLLSTS